MNTNRNNKRKLFLDFDLTIVNSMKKICDIYNEVYANHPKFVPADWTKNTSWDFKEVCPLTTREEINKWFGEERFFENLEFMENAEEVINELSQRYDICVASMGAEPNLSLKRKWIAEHLPCVKEYYPCNWDLGLHDKSHIDMSDCIFIEDSGDMLTTSNATIKICYGKIYPWNEKWNGRRCWDWLEIKHLDWKMIDVVANILHKLHK
jgi:5'(3')-deoxyribonucleotidase